MGAEAAATEVDEEEGGMEEVDEEKDGLEEIEDAELVEEVREELQERFSFAHSRTTGAAKAASGVDEIATELLPTNDRDFL